MSMPLPKHFVAALSGGRMGDPSPIAAAAPSNLAIAADKYMLPVAVAIALFVAVSRFRRK